MNFYEFCNCVCENVRWYMEVNCENVEVGIREKLAINGKYRAIVDIKSLESPWSQNYYLDELYQEYKDGRSMQDLCLKLIKEYESNTENISDISEKEIQNFDEMKDKITMKVINAKKNKEMLRSRPHSFIGDLAVVYQIVLPRKDEENRASISIDNNLLRMWGVTLADIHQSALRADKERSPYVLRDMQSVFLEYEKGQLGMDNGYEGENLLVDGKYESETLMLVLTNKDGIDGAAALANPSVMRRVLEIVDDDVYILPSSIHETIIVTKETARRTGLSLKELGEMVREINAEEVNKEEQLSDCVYEMSRDNRKLKIVKESMEKTKDWER